MEYNPTLWNDGDVISSEKMNKLEQGVKKAHEEIASNSNQTQTNKQNITTLKEDVVAKLDKNQGAKNNGKILGIGADGMVVPVDKPSGGTGGGVDLDTTLTSPDKAAPANLVGELKTSISSLTTEVEGENLFSGVFDTDGYYNRYNGGKLESSTGFKCSLTAFEVRDGIKKIYAIPSNVDMYNQVVALGYDAKDNYVKPLVFMTYAGAENNVDEGIKKIRFYYKKEISGNIAISYSPISQYKPYTLTMMLNGDKVFGGKFNLNKFYNKKCVFFGDSIIDGYGMPVSLRIPQLVGELSSMTVYNLGIGGTRGGKHIYDNYQAFSFYELANAIASNNYTSQESQADSVGKSAPNMVKLLKTIDFSTIDYMVISYGTNDWISSNTVNAETKDYTSFYYAMIQGIKTIREAYPKIKILLCTPIFRSGYGTKEDGYSDSYIHNGNNLKLIDFVECIKKIGKKCHVPVCDNYYGANIDSYNCDTYLSDGTHPFIPDGTGTKLIANRIYSQMMSNF